MTALGLTETQARLLGFIRAELDAGRPSPSFDQMRAFLDVRSKSNVHRLVGALVERGHIVRLPYRARSIGVPNEGEAASIVPRAVPSPPPISDRTLSEVMGYAARRGLPLSLVITTALTDYMRRNP